MIGTLILVLLLCVAPVAAIVRETDASMLPALACYGLAISGFTYFVYAWDKTSARQSGQRAPEKLLHLLEAIGGWPGALLAQRRLRHKSSKVSYQFVFWLIVTVHQFLAIDAWRGWPVLHRLFD